MVFSEELPETTVSTECFQGVRHNGGGEFLGRFVGVCVFVFLGNFWMIWESVGGFDF